MSLGRSVNASEVALDAGRGRIIDKGLGFGQANPGPPEGDQAVD